MNWKTTIVLAAIVLVGALYIGLVERKSLTTEEYKALAGKVFKVKDLSDHITEIAIKHGKDSFRFQRQGKDSDSPWRMLAPIECRADKSELRSIASAIEDVSIKNAVSSDEGINLADYGLDKPRARVSFKVKGKQYTLAFGNYPSPENKDEIFVKAEGDPHVYLVSDYLYEKITEKTKNDYRSKDVFEFDEDDVLAFSLAWGKEEKKYKSFESRKKAGEWRLMSPINDFAKESKIEDLIKKLTDLNIDKDDFVSDTMADAKNYGFDAPRLTVTLGIKAQASNASETEKKKEEKEEEEQETYKLILGKADAEKTGKLFAKRSDEPTVFRVSDSILDDLGIEELKDVRSDDFGHFDDSNVTKIEIALGTGEANKVILEQKEKKKEGEEEPEKAVGEAFKLVGALRRFYCAKPLCLSGCERLYGDLYGCCMVVLYGAQPPPHR